MIHSEEKRVAEEIIYELENSDIWYCESSYGGSFEMTNVSNAYIDPPLPLRRIVLMVDPKKWYWPFGEVRMDKPSNFIFSPSISRKLSRCIYKYVNEADSRKAKRKREKAMEGLKELYSNPKDGMLYVKKKIEIK